MSMELAPPEAKEEMTNDYEIQRHKVSKIFLVVSSVPPQCVNNRNHGSNNPNISGAHFEKKNECSRPKAVECDNQNPLANFSKKHNLESKGQGHLSSKAV